MHTHQHDEIKYVFIPIEQSYNNNLKNILFWTSFGEEKKAWANKAGLIGMFEVEWKHLTTTFWLNLKTIGSWILNITKSKLCWVMSIE